MKVCKGASLADGVVRDGPNDVKYKVMKCHKYNCNEIRLFMFYITKRALNDNFILFSKFFERL
jgi:hypothetical protein